MHAQLRRLAEHDVDEAVIRYRNEADPTTVLVFYLSDEDRIDIWRALLDRRDIPAFLTAEPPI